MALEDVFKKVVSHCKEYGYVFPSSEIYDGLSAVYDYGQYGVELKNNIKKYWWDSMVLLHDNVVGIDSAIFMHPTIWKDQGMSLRSMILLSTIRIPRRDTGPMSFKEEQIAKIEEKITKEYLKQGKVRQCLDEKKYRVDQSPGDGNTGKR